MRIVFLGSGEFGLPTLRALDAAHDLVGVVTQPDRPAGRKRQLTPTPVGQWVGDGGPRGDDIPLIKPANANDDDVIAQIAALEPDAGVVIAFGQKLSPILIEALGQGGGPVVNLHASLLPRWRGAAPINWAVMAGDTETGVSVIGLAQRMDAGLIYATARTPIDPMETAGELHDRLSLLGPDAVLDVLAEHEAGTLQGQPQDDSLATRAPKLSKADGKVDFSEPAAAVQRRVHGLTPWPGVTVTWRDTQTGEEQPLMIRRVEVVDRDATQDAPPGTILEGANVACGKGLIALRQIQQPGKRVMSIDEFTRGRSLTPGDLLK